MLIIEIVVYLRVKTIIMRKTLLLITVMINLFGCQQNSPAPSSSSTNAVPTSTNSASSDSLIVGTWSRYAYYEVQIKQNNTVCLNQVSNATGCNLTFNSNGTYTGSCWGSGTWTFTPSTNRLLMSSNQYPYIYLNNAQSPWCSLVTPVGSQTPTLYFNSDMSNTTGGVACDYYRYSQQRMRKL